MPRGRPAKILKERDIQLIVKQEVTKALSSLVVKSTLIGAKRKGRPIGSKLKRRGRPKKK